MGRGRSKLIEELTRHAEAANQADAERRAIRASAAASDWKAKALAYVDKLEEAEARIAFILGLKHPAIVAGEIKHIKKRGDRHSASIAGTLASDWHFGEEVDPREIPGGRNRYNPAIAEQRADTYAQNFLRVTNDQRASTTIHQAVAFLGGDFITGWIHPELMASNPMGPIQETRRVVATLQRVLDYWLKKGDFELITCLCSVGNHSRWGEREHSAPATKSLEWLAYHWLAEHYSKEKRLKFEISEARWATKLIGGVAVRYMHGNDPIKYQGGVGGIMVPMNRVLNSIGKADPADFTVMGHWHQWSPGSFFQINGSLIGYGPYSASKGFAYEPPQQGFFLISDKYQRVTLQAPIFVEG